MSRYITKKLGIVDVSVDDVMRYRARGQDGFRIYWSAEKLGFGVCDITFKDNKGRTTYAETEHMAANEDKNFLYALFNDIVEKLNVVD